MYYILVCYERFYAENWIERACKWAKNFSKGWMYLFNHISFFSRENLYYVQNFKPKVLAEFRVVLSIMFIVILQCTLLISCDFFIWYDSYHMSLLI